ncbi:MAG TPA: GGDEF domain-containing protein [Terracidiphilus sp.]|nr:GGDEF domain-containing protein [Terracidiphilus sp.]
MKWTRSRPALTAIAAVIFVCVHAALLAVFPRANDPISYSAFLVVSLWAGVLCALRGRSGSLRKRRNWALLAAGFVLWAAGNCFAAYIDVIAHGPSFVASWDDFFFFFSGVPFLLAISSPEDTRVFSLFFWLDVAQAAAVGCLTYLAVFGILPFSRAEALPIPVNKLVWLFGIEAFTLAVLSLARWAASPAGTRERRFFQVLAIYLWASALCQTEYNYLVVKYHDAGVWDILTDIAFLLFVVVAAFPQPEHPDPALQPLRRPVLVVVDHARPVLLGLALVALSAMVIRQHFALATGVIFGSFLVYGMRSAVLQSRFVQAQTELEKARDRLERLALLDGLTGVANRRAFDQRFATEWRRAQRTRLPLSLLLIDIDHFKKLNDTYGHLVGDECLIQVARTLCATLNRPSDLLARYGGEEFVALLPDTDATGAHIMAERLQAAMRRMDLHPALHDRVSVSIGGTTWNSEPVNAEQMVDAADRALYQAKQNGRDRIEYQSLQAVES